MEPDGSTVMCVSCGCTERGAFSKRMLERRGRFGERTRRCKSCVAAVEHEGPAQPLGVPDRWAAAQLVKEKNTQSWKTVLACEGLLAANAEAERAVATAHAAAAQVRPATTREEAEREAEAEAAAESEAEAGHTAKAAVEAVDELPDSEPRAAPRGVEGVEREKRKLQKALRSIAELKMRRANGEVLEATQLQKIAREGQLIRALDQTEDVAVSRAVDAADPDASAAALPALVVDGGGISAQGSRHFLLEAAENSAVLKQTKSSGMKLNDDDAAERRRRLGPKTKQPRAHANHRSGTFTVVTTSSAHPVSLKRGFGGAGLTEAKQQLGIQKKAPKKGLVAKKTIAKKDAASQLMAHFKECKSIYQ